MACRNEWPTDCWNGAIAFCKACCLWRRWSPVYEANDRSAGVQDPNNCLLKNASGNIMQEEASCKIHERRPIKEEASWRRRHGGINQEGSRRTSGQRHHEGGILEKASWRRRASCKRSLDESGSTWKASGEHLRGIWEALGKLWRCLGSLWQSGLCGQTLILKNSTQSHALAKSMKRLAVVGAGA